MWTIIEAGFVIGTYIYVSTDSVYEVTEANYTKESLDKIESDEDYLIEDEVSSSSSDDEETKEHRLNDVLVQRKIDHERREEDGFLKKWSRELVEYLRGIDSYAIEKLNSETLLIQSGIRHIILRLPDVIGPFDETGWFWKTYLLLTEDV